jgi:hypothetical protein
MTLTDIIRHTCSEIQGSLFHCGACGECFECDRQPAYCVECGMKFSHYFYVQKELPQLLSAGKA